MHWVKGKPSIIPNASRHFKIAAPNKFRPSNACERNGTEMGVFKGGPEKVWRFYSIYAAPEVDRLPSRFEVWSCSMRLITCTLMYYVGRGGLKGPDIDPLHFRHRDDHGVNAAKQTTMVGLDNPTVRTLKTHHKKDYHCIAVPSLTMFSNAVTRIVYFTPTVPRLSSKYFDGTRCS